MAEQPPPPQAAPAKAGGPNKIMLLVGMLVAAGISGGATFFLTRPKEVPPGKDAVAVASKAREKTEGTGEEEEDESEATEEDGEHPVINLPFVVNLGEDMNDPHYLKVSIAIELTAEGEDAAKSFDSKAPKVRGALLMLFSSLKAEDVQGKENRQKLLLAVRKQVKQAAGRKAVRGVYITELVVQ